MKVLEDGLEMSFIGSPFDAIIGVQVLCYIMNRCVAIFHQGGIWKRCLRICITQGNAELLLINREK